ncbi:MAG: glycosyltransferase [Prevotellaceae bacterium]|jgi:glycosyltransferase involved in cell wall biosynthesis|nr:glycosyltransferase [Prevotellaceae bacterium]
MNELAIVIPVYNEAENIRTAIERIEARLTVPHAIYLVYDMDGDTTLPAARAAAADFRAPVVFLKNKYGRGVLNAIKTGLDEADAPLLIVTMADLSDPPEVMNRMVETANAERADVVCASRYMAGGRQYGGLRLKSLFSRLAGISLHRLTGIPTHDISNSFKLYRRTMLDALTIESRGGFEIGMEITVKAFIAGYTVSEVPTTWRDRQAGQSRFKLWAWLPLYLRWYWYCISHKRTRHVR